MLKTLAAVAVLASVLVPVVPAHADPADYIDPSVNYRNFLEELPLDGIVMDNQQAIHEGLSVCELMHPPNHGSLWDAGQHVLLTHPDWRIQTALTFSDRAVQNICPNWGTF